MSILRLEEITLNSTRLEWLISNAKLGFLECHKAEAVLYIPLQTAVGDTLIEIIDEHLLLQQRSLI